MGDNEQLERLMALMVQQSAGCHAGVAPPQPDAATSCANCLERPTGCRRLRRSYG